MQEKQPTNENLKAHGMAGSLYMKLQRTAIIGWSLFFLLLLLVFIYAIVSALVPSQVIAVDESGRILGTFEYMDSSQRTNEEIIAGAQFFARNYVNVNSATIFDDYASAVNMMTPGFSKQVLTDVRRSGYLTAVKEADTTSRVHFYTGKNKPQIIRREGNEASVNLKGDIAIIYIDGNEKRTPFDITVSLKLVPRSTLSTHGLQILKLTEKEIKYEKDT